MRKIKALSFGEGWERPFSVDEYKPAGEYEVDFRPESSIKHLPAGRQGPASGIYFYRLIAGSYIQTKKMVFLK